jgi:hypothetical protein
LLIAIRTAPTARSPAFEKHSTSDRLLPSLPAKMNEFLDDVRAVEPRRLAQDVDE